jgi:hypothetical protein
MWAPRTLAAELEAVVIAREARLQDAGRPDGAGQVGTPGVDVGGRRSRSEDRIVEVDAGRQLAAERGHVGGAHAEVAEELLLHGEVHLVRVRPDEVEVGAEHGGGQREARAGRIVVERERATPPGRFP